MNRCEILETNIRCARALGYERNNHRDLRPYTFKVIRSFWGARCVLHHCNGRTERWNPFDNVRQAELVARHIVQIAGHGISGYSVHPLVVSYMATLSLYSDDYRATGETPSSALAQVCAQASIPVVRYRKLADEIEGVLQDADRRANVQ